jgi:hypothetical protein
MILPTASELPRVIRCPSSAVLPRVETSGPGADFGRDVHAFLADQATMSSEEALARVPTDEARAACEVLDMSKLPVFAESMPEVSFAWNAQNDTARVLGTNRDYLQADRLMEIVGTVDLVRIGQAVIVSDFKTGNQHRPPAAQDPQLWFAVLAAARHYGVQEVIGEIIHIPPGASRPRYDRATFDAFAIDSIAREFRILIARIRDRSQRQGILPVEQGPHCQYCPALPHCPATRALLVTEKGDPAANITRENAADAYRSLQALKRIAGRVQQVIEFLAAQDPIPLGDGVYYGPHEVKRQEIDGAIAFNVIKESFGEDVALTACEMNTTKTAIADAVRPLAKTTGLSIKKLKDGIMQAIREEGGVTDKVVTRREEYKPDGR